MTVTGHADRAVFQRYHVRRDDVRASGARQPMRPETPSDGQRRNACAPLVRAASLASAFLLGLLAGSMLLIALAVAPFWQSLPPAEFRAWFAAHAFRIGRLM